ncbi:MAG: hypothetical protein M0P74_10420 [Syntrophales bacterium]|jgi:ArsR family metal-binding transcriptional regulator|nr:hypothetical protein [Syntrophales bacterium]
MDNRVSESNKLINGYTLELLEPGCSPGADEWTAKAHLDDDISALFPYLNAKFTKARYYPDSQAIVFDYETRKCSLRAQLILAASFGDRTEATEFMEYLIKMMNDLWQNRSQIEPSYDKREPPRAMDILKLLPRTNCKECGSLTCMAFANQLREGNEDVSKCTQLSDENRKKLLILLKIV